MSLQLKISVSCVMFGGILVLICHSTSEILKLLLQLPIISVPGGARKKEKKKKKRRYRKLKRKEKQIVVPLPFPKSKLRAPPFVPELIKKANIAAT